MDILENVAVDGATNDEFDQIERAFHVHEPPPDHSPHFTTSPAHTMHFSDHFVGTSFGATHASHTL